VADDVLADRVRSALGPIERRLDVPRVHVMVHDHIVVVHGDVPTRRDRDEIVSAVVTMPGVRGVEDLLHIGLLAGDTRPSAGRIGLRRPTSGLGARVGRGPVGPYASPSLAYVTPEATLREVARHLAAVDVGVLVIGSADAVTGVVGERDVSRALADDADPEAVWAADVARRPVVRAAPDDTVDVVANRMLDEGVRHALVMDGEVVTGVVSMRDLLAAYARPGRAAGADG
jgi:CBS domain-containing protein